MLELNCIEESLSVTGWNRARVKLLARFLVALIVCRSVCLTRVANVLFGTAKTESNYRRLQRFLSGFALDPLVLARLMLQWLERHCGLEGPYVLAMDRTNWKFGKTELNTLVLAVVHKGVGFPLLWTVLGKAGNSSAAERQALLNQYLSAFSSESIAYLCADREFGGKAFLSWLQRERISFVIRLRGNVRMANAKGEMKKASGLFWHEKIGQMKVLGERKVFGNHGNHGNHGNRGNRGSATGKSLSLQVAGMRLRDGDFLIVVSDKESFDQDDLLTAYGKRWGIETLFGCLKSRGFDLEATHLQEEERLSRLLSVLALAYSWAYVCGHWLFEQKPWKVRKHKRLPMSLFRKGLDFLQRILISISGNKSQQDMQNAIRFLSCT